MPDETSTRCQVFRGAEFELQIRYGQAPAQPAIHELFEAPKRPNDVVVEERMSLDSRPGSIRRWRRGSPHPYIEVGIDAPGRTPEQHFNAIAHCTTAVACGEAEAIVRTVRFLR